MVVVVVVLDGLGVLVVVVVVFDGVCGDVNG